MTDRGAALIMMALGIFTALQPALVVAMNNACSRLFGVSDQMIKRISPGVTGTRIMDAIFAVIGLVIYLIDDGA